jgi:predicted amidohydrolase
VLETATVALWAVNMADAPASMQAMARRIEARMAEAREAGADILALPEYVSEPWLALAPPHLPEAEEVAWMAGQGAELLELIRPLPARYGMALLAGTWPERAQRRWVNRARLLLPDGRIVTQDKLCLTPSEKEPHSWMLGPGGEVTIVEWQGLRIAVLVCLDVELPALAARLQASDLDLVLVPSLTRLASGHARVTACARARAVELMTTVCVVGCVGATPLAPPRPNTGGAAAYLPCEPALGHRGVAVELLGRAEASGPGPLVLARDLPLGRVRALRHGEAEVWPGPWPAEHLHIVQA